MFFIPPLQPYDFFEVIIWTGMGMIFVLFLYFIVNPIMDKVQKIIAQWTGSRHAAKSH